jgi:hypothetical protein
MEPMGRVLGPASTNFNDYLGTVAADDAVAVMDQPSLYELAEVDRNRYTILAVDLRVNGGTTAIVYAIDRAEHPDTLQTVDDDGPSQDEIPVVPFPVPQPKVEPLIRHAFGEISVRLVTNRLRECAIVVSEPSAT